MSKKAPNYVVTDLEDTDEEELVKNLLTTALNQSPKISRGTSTIKEWMAIIEGSQDLNRLLALAPTQRQSLETYASRNPDMELDTDHIMCMYSMIRKSQPLDISANGSPTLKASNLTKPHLTNKQHSLILQQNAHSPSSPTPSEQQQQQQSSFRLESSASQHISNPSSRLLDNDTDDVPFRPQSKGKKVSIDPTLIRHAAAIKDNLDDISKHSSDNGNSNTRLKNTVSPAHWSTPSINVDDTKGDDNTKSRMSSLFDDTEDGYNGNNGYQSPNVIHERMIPHRQNSKLSFQPLDGNWKSQGLNSNPTSHRQQEQQEQRADQNAILLDALLKEMEVEIQTLRQKTSDQETQEARQKDQIEELTARIKTLNSQVGSASEQYEDLRDQLSDEIDKLQEKEKRNQVELDSARNALMLNKQKCIELQQESMYWKTAVEKKHDEYGVLQKDLDHQKASYEKLELELYMKADGLKKSLARVEELECTIPPNMTAEKVQETLKMVDRLQKEKEQYDTIINSTVKELASMTKGYDELQQKVKELERQRDQQLKEMAHTTGPSSLWYQRESINQDKKRLSSVCKQLDSQANVIDQLRLQILSNGSKLKLNTTENTSPRWLVVLLGALGFLLTIMLSVAIYAVNTPPVTYGLWNDPHGYQGQWSSDAPSSRSAILLMLDRLLLPKNYTFTPPM